jgi:hypothetical protein
LGKVISKWNWCSKKFLKWALVVHLEREKEKILYTVVYVS